MKRRFCKLSTCRKLLPVDRHGNAWTCTKEHAWVLKKEREAMNYKKMCLVANPILELEDQLKELADKFGYEVEIDLEQIQPITLNWSIKTGSFQVDNHKGIVVGKLAYLLFHPNHIKIYKNDKF
jgi:hypothetical protein